MSLIKVYWIFKFLNHNQCENKNTILFCLQDVQEVPKRRNMFVIIENFQMEIYVDFFQALKSKKNSLNEFQHTFFKLPLTRNI